MMNGNVTEQAITRDLEEMKAKGFGGAGRAFPQLTRVVADRGCRTQGKE